MGKPDEFSVNLDKVGGEMCQETQNSNNAVVSFASRCNELQILTS